MTKTKLVKMTEDRARTIWLSVDTLKYPIDECRAADRWIKDYAMAKFRRHSALPAHATLKRFLIDTATAHFGSIEVDDMMTELDCYPQWMKNKR